MRAIALLTALSLATVLDARAASASPGDLDPTFGTNGVVTEPLFREANAVALQSDGYFVAVSSAPGGIRVTRFAPAGPLDGSFGSGGTVVTPLGFSVSANAVAIQSDGMIVVAGESDGKFVLARYDTGGTLDGLFGTGGVVVTPIGTDAVAYAVVVQSTGAIVAAGYTLTGGGSPDFAIARYTPSGVLDATFGTGGTVVVSMGSGVDILHALLLGSADALTAVGESSVGATVLRFDANGVLDPAFGTGGVFTTTAFYSASAGAFQSDGKIVIAGATPFISFAVARVAADGSALDNSFGGDGAVVTGFDDAFSAALSVVVEPDGRIVAAGGNAVPGPGPTGGVSSDFALVRYLSDGSLDSSFGTGGRVDTDLGMSESILAAALDGDTLVVAGGQGTGSIFSEPYMIVARYRVGPVCTAIPATGCKAPIEPGKALLQIVDDVPPDTGDRLQWKLRKAQATDVADFGDPTTTDGYALCIYDESGVDPLITLAFDVPRAGDCDGKPCWSASGTKGFKYKSKDGAPNGIHSIKLTAGAEGKAKITVKGKGGFLPELGLPLPLPARVQLQASNGSCWEAEYSAAGMSVNDPAEFDGKSD